MRLTALLLLIGCLHATANGYSQTVTFSGKNVPLKVVFVSFEKQTGLSFFFNYALIKNTKPVTLDLKDVALDDALHEALKDEGLDFYIAGKTIFIVRKSPVAANKDAVPFDTPPAQMVDVKGKVTDPEGQPLSGASVTVKNGNQGTITDEKGFFSLHNIVSNAILQISYAGYQKAELSADGQGTLNVVMHVANTVLDQAQVIAYGTTTARFAVGNTTTVKGTDIDNQPVTNPMLALEGRVPGLFITQNTGVSNGQVTVRIQGQNSIRSGNDPLYIIDGVPYVSELPTLGTGDPTNGGNPLAFINTSDIESISVLKDADATAIYGSRAANGAILINTKKGKPGRTAFDINAQQGWGQVAHKLDLLNTRQYLDMRYEAYRNDNINWTLPSYVANDLKVWDTTRYTDWQKTLIGSTAQYSNFSATVSGGDLSTQYVVGGTYNRVTSVYPGSSADNKASAHLSLNTTSLNQRFKMLVSTDYMADDNELPNVDLTISAVRLAPDAPALYNPDGSLNWALNAAGSSTWSNPLTATLFNKFSNKTNNLIGTTKLSYAILKGLTLIGSAGYTDMQTTTYSPHPLLGNPPEVRPNVLSIANYGRTNVYSWTLEPELDYKFVLGKGVVEAMAGTTIYRNIYDANVEQGSGYSSDILLPNPATATKLSPLLSQSAIYKYNAAFGRLNYNWDEKYIIGVTGRRDGSSRFGPQNQFHDFASIGAAWIFSQEQFVAKIFPALSFGKLKGSYGTTGNDQIGDYNYLSQYYVNNGGLVAYQNSSGLALSNIANPYLQWEETRKIQWGIDLGFWKNRILLDATYSRNRSANELLPYTLPSITGFTSITENFPATVRNTSWEFSLNTINVKSKTVSWSSGVNLTIPQNKLIAFPNLTTSSYANLLVIGQPVTVVKAYHFLGVNPQNGLYVVADAHGNPTATPNSTIDRTVLISTLPKFYGGFQSSLSWKRLQLDFLITYVRQIGTNSLYFTSGSNPGSPSYNQFASVLSRWRKPGDITPIARFGNSVSTSAATLSDAGYSDAASYMRLKNLSLSWSINTKGQKKYIQNCRLYVQGQNLLTITRFNGLDPESQSFAFLPPLRVITVGIQAGF